MDTMSAFGQRAASHRLAAQKIELLSQDTIKGA